MRPSRSGFPCRATRAASGHAGAPARNMTPSGNPDLMALAKGLRRQKPKGGRMSLLAISAELAAQGFLNENGRAFAAASIKSMLGAGRGGAKSDHQRATDGRL